MRLLAETLKTSLVRRWNGHASNVIPFLANREKLGRWLSRSGRQGCFQQTSAAPELERPAQTDINTGRLERCACPGATLEEERGAFARQVSAREARRGRASGRNAQQGSKWIG